jgi:hypothetical protein
MCTFFFSYVCDVTRVYLFYFGFSSLSEFSVGRSPLRHVQRRGRWARRNVYVFVAARDILRKFLRQGCVCVYDTTYNKRWYKLRWTRAAGSTIFAWKIFCGDTGLFMVCLVGKRKMRLFRRVKYHLRIYVCTTSEKFNNGFDRRMLTYIHILWPVKAACATLPYILYRVRDSVGGKLLRRIARWS